ncbi:MAG: PrpF protein, partial [Solobacterium sp.]|nr:PrpF protein [Solobacterium sp.]
MKEQQLFRCTYMRGGTSKAVFIKKNELPVDIKERDEVIKAIFSTDERQIDGMGGADITTSKVAIVSPSNREDADVDYNFGQVQIGRDAIDWNTNCGNISSAVGPFAIDEGMVKTTDPLTEVRIYNVNTDKILVAKVETKDGRAAVHGDFVLDGVPGTGSRIELDYCRTAGAATGRLLPTGNPTDILMVDGVGEV